MPWHPDHQSRFLGTQPVADNTGLRHSELDRKPQCGFVKGTSLLQVTNRKHDVVNAEHIEVRHAQAASHDTGDSCGGSSIDRVPGSNARAASNTRSMSAGVVTD
jgi:hypothetical protein